MYKLASPIFFALFLLVSCSSSDESQSTVSKSLKLEGTSSAILIDLVDLPREEILKAHKSGQIESIHKQNFYKKNAPILHLKNNLAFNRYSDKFEVLKSNMKRGLDNFPSEMESIKGKWEKFYNALNLTKEPPLFPKLKYAEEESFVNNFKLKSSYTDVLKAYLSMDDYFIAAPNDGFIDDWKVKPNQTITKNQELASFYPAAIKIYYRIPEKASSETIKNAKKALIASNPRIQTIREIDNQFEVTINLKNKADVNQIPLSVPAGNLGFRFVIPDNQVKNGEFKYSLNPDLSNLKSAKSSKTNAHFTAYLKDSIIYLPR